ncbi:MAG: thioredoxin domain-containing protein [Acidobacteria bacterium]|nr:thioredoxin domain-containing protein [Acidobacteriota bacterium]
MQKLDAQKNRLASEQSPYLLQHAANPVDWYPWGDEAFHKARRENKPIFLSIGYSTCHWCHVMEHESFESARIADLLNGDFVSIKVDREERPDVDRVYMTFVQATTGSGGWPMSVWLTPDLKPFYGGTYFPPSSRWGRPGFAEILQEIARVWKDDRPRVDQAAESLTAQLAATAGATRSEPGAHGDDARPLAPVETIAEGVEQYRRSFDARRGGFGEAPKFPRPSELLFLLRAHALGQSGPAALTMALETLRAMALGGMRDHIGGGFHRYSVDAEWRVPHFEKMLYDQAQLTLAYLEAAQASGDRFYATVARDTLEYVRREMTDPHGGFYSAEDADSIPPEVASDPVAKKTEGAFYIWTDDEVGALLGADADIVRKRFGIEPDGNAPQDPHGEFTGRNLLYTSQSIEDISARTGRAPDEVEAALARARRVLFDARRRRPRPHLDDKILTAWNGLMIAAFARAARVLHPGDGASPYLASARSAASFIRTTMWDATRGTLLRRYREGQAAIEGYSEDYACLIWGLLELFQADGDPSCLDWAIRLQNVQDDLFWDPVDGGWFSTTGRDPSVLLRLKEDYDGAEPSPSSVSVLNLLALAHLAPDGGDAYAANAERTLRRFGPRLGEAARAVPLMLCGLAAYHAGMAQVVIAGERDREDTTRLLAVVGDRYLPYALVVPVYAGGEQERLAHLLPWVRTLRMMEGRAAAYVCRNFACEQPATEPDVLVRALG